jgi:hypothetical protein
MLATYIGARIERLPCKIDGIIDDTLVVETQTSVLRYADNKKRKSLIDEQRA